MQMQGDDNKSKGWFYKQVIVYRTRPGWTVHSCVLSFFFKTNLFFKIFI